MSTKLWLLATTCVVLSACGASANDSGTRGSGNSASSCSITLSGAMSGTYGCIFPPQVMWSPGGEPALLQFMGPDDESTLSISIALYLPGVPRATTYRSNVESKEGMVRVSGGENGPLYGAFIGTGNDRGSYTVTLTSANRVVATYTVHGSIVATMLPEPGTGASGTVTLRATF